MIGDKKRKRLKRAQKTPVQYDFSHHPLGANYYKTQNVNPFNDAKIYTPSETIPKGEDKIVLRNSKTSGEKASNKVSRKIEEEAKKRKAKKIALKRKQNRSKGRKK